MAEISVVVPVKNGAAFLPETLHALLVQSYADFEVCIYDDGSTDRTPEVIKGFEKRFKERGVPLHVRREKVSKGVGYAKNGAVSLASGRFLCFNDADDVSTPTRLEELVKVALSSPDPDNVFIGSQFTRIPEGSTDRFTRWANGLTDDELGTQIYTAFGPTLVAPTWFIPRKLYDRVGGFNGDHPRGYPEDLDFFYKALIVRPALFKVRIPLLVYRYHSECATHSVSDESIWQMRVAELQKRVLNTLQAFSIWNAGKQGKRLFRSLSETNRRKVAVFCDVDERKISRGAVEIFDEKERRVTHTVPIVSYRDVRPPVIVCVKWDLTAGRFEELLAAQHWRHGHDFFHFG